jgi:N-acetylmuramoyl-L-alanine amidase
MIRKAFLLGLTAILSGLGAFSPALGAELRAIHLVADTNSAQVTLELTAGTAQKLFTLGNPDRVVIDLPRTRVASGLHAPPPSGIVTGVRFGTQPHGTLRVVLQLRSALPVRGSWGSGDAGRQLLLTLGEPVLASREPAPKPQHLASREPAPKPQHLASREPAPKVEYAVHAPGEGDRDVIIAVDAGHGGVDPGAIGHGGTREKDVTLAIARALAKALDSEPGMRAVLTRDRDEFIELRERIHRARMARADMFISVHADSIVDRGVSGASVYVLSVHGASSEAARWLAERENAADLVGGVRLDDKGALAPVLLDAAQSEIIGVSASAAERVVSALEGVGELRRAQVQQAGFVVLKSPDIPSMLVETAYISNPAEERRLRQPAQQARLAAAIASGVRTFFTQNPPDGTRFKQERRATLASAAGDSGAATP